MNLIKTTQQLLQEVQLYVEQKEQEIAILRNLLGHFYSAVSTTTRDNFVCSPQELEVLKAAVLPKASTRADKTGLDLLQAEHDIPDADFLTKFPKD